MFPPPAKHTKRYLTVCADDIDLSELVIYARDADECRGRLPLWREIRGSRGRQEASITRENKEEITVERTGETVKVVSLRDEKGIADVIRAERLLIDITGLPHHVWAPLLKAAHGMALPTRVLYAEPEKYKSHPTPASATTFDLSLTIEGLAPLPGFARLSGPGDETKCLFIALLGFEGNRPERLVIQVDPTPKVIPIVGVPGFRYDYPEVTVACNRIFLNEYRAYSEIRFARASCPFEVYESLNDICKDFPDHYMYLAPVGTKPHSLGAIWYAITHAESTEVMFDYPVRRPDRTSGVGIIHIYDFGEFDVD